MDRAVRYFTAGMLLVLLLVGTAHADDAADQFAVAAGHYTAERWKLAADEFQQFLAAHAEHPMRPQATFYRAESLVQMGKLAEARELFGQLLEDKGNSSLAKRALFRRGEASFLAGEDAAAKADLEAFNQQHSPDDLDAYVLPYLGELALRGEDTAAAIEFYKAAEKRFGKGPLADECRFGLARANEKLGKTQDAATTYTAIAADAYAPLADKALFQLGAMHNAAGEFEQALKTFDQFANQHKESPLLAQVKLARGWTFYKLDKFNEAQAEFASLVESPEQAVETGYWLGMTYSARGRWGDAIEAFRKAADGVSDHRLQPAIAYHLAEALRQHGELAAANEHFTRVTSEWPDSPYAVDALFGKLQLAIKQEAHAEAITLANELLASRAESAQQVAAECQSTLAVCHARLGQLEEAKAAIAELKAKHAESELIAPTLHKIAEAAYQKGDQELAKSLFGELSTSEFTEEWKSRGLAGLAWSQLKGEDLAASADTFEKLLKDHPGGPLVATAALLRGQTLEKLGQDEAALAMYRRVIDEHPKSEEVPQALFRAALLHDKLRQFADATRCYELILADFLQFAERPEALFQLGCLKAETGELDAARQSWEEVRKNHATSAVWGDATYRLATAALDAHDYGNCHRYLGELDRQPPAEALQPYALLLRGRLAAAEQKWDKVGAPLEKLLADFPEHTTHSSASFWIAEAAYRTGDFAKAEEQFGQLKSQTTDEKLLPMASLRRAQSLAQLGKWEEALELARAIGKEHPQFDALHEVDYLIGRGLASQADFAGAREAYTRVVRSETAGKSETAAMAQWMIGESYFHQEDYAAALRAYLRVEILYAWPKWQAAALLQAGKCHEQLGEWKEATETYSKLLTTYRDSDVAEEAAKRLGVAEQQRRGETVKK